MRDGSSRKQNSRKQGVMRKWGWIELFNWRRGGRRVIQEESEGDNTRMLDKATRKCIIFYR